MTQRPLGAPGGDTDPELNPTGYPNDAPPGPPQPGYAGDMFTSPDGSGDVVYGGGGGGGTGGGGGGGGGGASSTTDRDYDGPGKDYNDADENARFLGVPGHPAVWRDTDSGQVFLMYEAQGTEPPIPLLYEIPDEETLQAFFGEGEKIVYDKEVSRDEMDGFGSIRFGTTNNLEEEDGDPWLGFLDRVDRAAEVQPWLQDDEVLALFGGAYLEGRELQDWELESTEWWQTQTENQRAWAKLSIADPETAAQKMSDDQAFVRDLFAGIGADGNDPELIKWLGQQYTTGAWSESYLKDQVEAVTTGYYDVDESLQDYMAQAGLAGASTMDGHEQVRALWNEWLGPAYQPSEEQVAKWATQLRKSADGQDELVNMLRGQRMALFSMYEDPNLTYQDIAGAWRSQVQNVWGQRPDETSDMFQQIVRLNDYGEANKILRKEGLAQGIDKVWSDAVRSTGSSVRRAL